MAILHFLFLFPFIAHSITLQVSDGDVVECIDKYNQPAFSHPFLKNHKIQETPSEIPIMRREKKKWPTLEAHVSTAECPSGTVPKRLGRANSSSTRPKSTRNISSNPKHEYAEAIINTTEKLFGAQATINIWDPMVEDGDEFSLSQFWISYGDYSTNNLNTIEVGWQVYSGLYNDNKPRLFIYWTSDGYKTTGSYNLQKPGFIQISSHIVLGGSISPISSFGGIQYEITVLVWKDRKSGNWWLSLGPNNTLVGYWPKEIFTGLADHAISVAWGGEIVDSHIFGRHTKTHMGSGHFPEEGFRKASYFRNLEIVDSNNNCQPVQQLQTNAEEKHYDIKLYRDGPETYFFYGGSEFSQTRSGVIPLGLNSFLNYVIFSFFIIF